MSTPAARQIAEKFAGEKLAEVVKAVRGAIEIKERKYKFGRYPQTFVGRELIYHLISAGHVQNLDESHALADLLLTSGHIKDVIHEGASV